MNFSTRKEALESGAETYNTGEPCKNGHYSDRRTSNGKCIECLRAASRRAQGKYRAKNRDAIKRRTKELRANNIEHHRAKGRERYRRRAEKAKAYSRQYRSANREQVLAALRRYYRENKDKFVQKDLKYRTLSPERYAMKAAKRRKAIIRATPPWYGELDELAMSEAFHLAVLRKGATGISWHVDHVIPLNGESACGLHCATNIQVITATENLSKGNRMPMVAE